MPKARSRWLGLLACTAVALYLCWQILQPFIEVVLWAGVLAVVAHPVQRWFLTRTGRPTVSAGLTCTFIILVLVIPLGLIGLLVIKQAYPAVQSLQTGIYELTHPATMPATLPATQSATAPATQPDSPLHRYAIFRAVDRYFDLDSVLNPQFINARLKELGAFVAEQSLALLGGVLQSAVKICFTLFALFYLLADAPRILKAIHDSLPVDADQADRIFLRAEEVISASVFGVLVIAAIQGTMGGIAFAFLGLPSPVLWGAVMFLLSMIPMAGSALVWAPAAIYLLATGHPYKAAFLVAWGAGAIGMIDNVLRPRLVGGKAKLHELVIFFAVLGGIQVFGVLGLFVGPVVVALTLTLMDVYRRAQAEAEATPDTAVVVAPVQAAPPAPQPASTPPPQNPGKKKKRRR